MKNINLFFTIIVCLLIGYALGNFFPLNIFGSESPNDLSGLPETGEEGIEGDVKLEVVLKMDSGEPVANVEVDLAEKPGPPPAGGAVFTDENGLAVFNVKPGNYFLFFNDNNFPADAENPGSQQINIISGKINQKTIILNLK